MADPTLPDRIIDAIEKAESPGDLSYRALARSTDSSKGSIEHHVGKMLKTKTVRRNSEGLLEVATVARQLVLAVDVESMHLAHVTTQLRSRGLITEALELDGFYNLLVTMKTPFSLSPADVQGLLTELGARDVRILGEVVARTTAA